MTIRPMRGQVVVRELVQQHSAILWTPEDRPRQVRTHRGRVLAMGPPSRLVDLPDAPEVPWGFGVGDVIQYHFEHHQEAWTCPWPDDGLPATWLPQAFVDGVET